MFIDIEFNFRCSGWLRFPWIFFVKPCKTTFFSRIWIVVWHRMSIVDWHPGRTYLHASNGSSQVHFSRWNDTTSHIGRHYQRWPAKWSESCPDDQPANWTGRWRGIIRWFLRPRSAASDHYRRYHSVTNITHVLIGQYNAFTCVTFKGEGFTLGAPTEYGVWSGDKPIRNTTTVPPVPGEALVYLGIWHCKINYNFNLGSEVGALLTFPPSSGGGKTTILARVGVSFISRAQACSNANSEIPDFNFESVHSANRAQWNELLGRIQVDTTGVPIETVQLFYSSVGVCLSSKMF